MGTVASEIIAQQCIAVRLRMVNRAVSRLYDRALRPHGITVSQLNILVVISQHGQARQQDVCRTLFMERSTVSRDVVRMQANGWIDITTGADARTSVMKVTPEGKKLLEKVLPAWKTAQQRAIIILGENQISVLDQAIAVLRTESTI